MAVASIPVGLCAPSYMPRTPAGGGADGDGEGDVGGDADGDGEAGVDGDGVVDGRGASRGASRPGALTPPGPFTAAGIPMTALFPELLRRACRGTAKADLCAAAGLLRIRVVVPSAMTKAAKAAAYFQLVLCHLDVCLVSLPRVISRDYNSFPKIALLDFSL